MVSEGQVQALRHFVATDEGARIVIAVLQGRPPGEISHGFRGLMRALEWTAALDDNPPLTRDASHPSD